MIETASSHSTYELFRQLADSWGLLAMLIMWLAFGLWTFRPGSRSRNKDAANLIFKDENDG